MGGFIVYISHITIWHIAYISHLVNGGRGVFYGGDAIKSFVGGSAIITPQFVWGRGKKKFSGE